MPVWKLLFQKDSLTYIRLVGRILFGLMMSWTWFILLGVATEVLFDHYGSSAEIPTHVAVGILAGLALGIGYLLKHFVIGSIKELVQTHKRELKGGE